MKETLPIKKTDSIFAEVEKMQERIMRRAYEIFEGSGRICGKDLENWLLAESELIWAPPIDMEERDREITVKLSAPGIAAKDIEVELTPQDLLVEAEAAEEREKKKGKIRRHEMRTAKLFRSVHFPKKIDPDSAKAELKDGVLKLTAKVVKEEVAKGRKIKVSSA